MQRWHPQRRFGKRKPLGREETPYGGGKKHVFWSQKKEQGRKPVLLLKLRDLSFLMRVKGIMMMII